MSKLKKLWKSKTLWANLLMAALELFVGVGSVEVTTIVNGVLRLVTDSKLTVNKVVINRLSMFAIMFLFMASIVSMTACSFIADGVKYDDGKTQTSIEHIETDIEKL